MKKTKNNTEDKTENKKISDNMTSDDILKSPEKYLENPEKYLEINIIKLDKFRMVDTFYKNIKDKEFKYDGKKYTVDSKCIFLTIFKKSFIPTSYYIEGCTTPLEFKNENKHIPCNALSLLWKYKLYKVLMQLEEKNINFILIVLLIASMIMYGVSLYFRYGGVN